MTQRDRLRSGGVIDRSKPLAFTFNGTRYEGYSGDTLASALLANGIHFVARSFKYHRPRGIVSAGVEEPNALVQLERGAHTIPNARSTEIELYDGLIAESVNASPSLEHDRLAFLGKLGRFTPAGFYYKTFMWPSSWWPRYERAIREAAGLGCAPDAADPARYDKIHAHCDVLVVGAGPSGLAAAYAAGATGARVMLLEHDARLDGRLIGSNATIDGIPGVAWAERIIAELRDMPEVTILNRTTVFGYHEHNLLTACERRTDHLPIAERTGVRERLWKIRAKRVILATGAIERPIVFGNNDLPGIMLASAVSTYIGRYAVKPGQRALVFCNNDGAYRAALDLHTAGAHVAIVDVRPPSETTLQLAVRSLGIGVMNGSCVLDARGSTRVQAALVAAHGIANAGPTTAYECDLIATSGGWNPTLHLHAQSGGRARWREDDACFVPGEAAQDAASVGAANGDFSLSAALRFGARAGYDAATQCGYASTSVPAWACEEAAQAPLFPLWSTGDHARARRGAKRFVDFQNDVTDGDIVLAAREGYTSIEHVKRYTMLGFGTDQGKIGNINGLALLAQALRQTIPETGTTTFRPNYTPVTFGTFAGREIGAAFDPVRTTCIHQWHVERGAVFEDVGTWKRPWYYPAAGEDLHAAVARECRTVRTAVGLFDASTLGKIDLQGRDAVTLLNRVYSNDWETLDLGKCRYGVMLDENGMVFDDGVTARLAAHHFLVSTTTGGAARVFNWIERWLQTEWPQLEVYATSVTDHFATIALAGPHARKVLRKLCDDIDLSPAAFPFMSSREGHVASVPARLMRISFSGELAYEINVPANFGCAVWNTLVEAGEEFGIAPYGTEAMHVLRAEKGYVIVGQDTDGSVTPHDLGMSKLVSQSKDFLGKRSLARTHTSSPDRKQLIGLLTADPLLVPPEGTQIVQASSNARVVSTLGHVTSSYISPTLNRSIALALVKSGRERMGTSVSLATGTGRYAAATVVQPVFYDPRGDRQRAD